MQTGTRNESPCRFCVRVRDPANCENKLCKDWQAWFIDRWESMRRAVMAEAHGKGIQGAPISVGGTKYHHPDRMREFLENDPCLECPFGGGLCLKDCTTRQAWMEAKERCNELESGSGNQAEEVRCHEDGTDQLAGRDSPA